MEEVRDILDMNLSPTIEQSGKTMNKEENKTITATSKELTWDGLDGLELSNEDLEVVRGGFTLSGIDINVRFDIGNVLLLEI